MRFPYSYLMVILVILCGSPFLAAKDEIPDGWPQYYGTPDHNNYRKVKDKIKFPKVLWRLDRVALPAVLGDEVYAGGDDLCRAKLETGEELATWKPDDADTEFRIAGTPVILDDKVIVVTSQGIYALSRDLSKMIWSVKADGNSWFSPVSDGELVVFTTGTKVIALETKDGSERWKKSFSRKQPVEMSPAMADGKVLFGSKNGTFYALDKKDGEELWTYEGNHAFAWTDPVVNGKRIFVGDRGGNINAIDLKKGKLLWSWESGATGLSVPGIMPGKILVGFSRFVATIKEKDGKLDTSNQGFRTGKNPFGSPTLVGKTLYFGNLDGHLYAYDYKKEKRKWAFEVGEGQQVHGFVYHKDILLVRTTEGIYAIGNDPKKKRLPKAFVLLSEDA